MSFGVRIELEVIFVDPLGEDRINFILLPLLLGGCLVDEDFGGGVVRELPIAGGALIRIYFASLKLVVIIR